MADRQNTKKALKFTTILVIVIFVALFGIMFAFCGNANDADQLGTDEPLSLVVPMALDSTAG